MSGELACRILSSFSNSQQSPAANLAGKADPLTNSAPFAGLVAQSKLDGDQTCFSHKFKP